VEKILLDTDIGGDIDDSVCLAYLLSQPECELKGITTVYGPTVTKAKIASAICKAAGKDVPIVPGLRKPLMSEKNEHPLRQAVALEKWPHDTVFPDQGAIPFMRDVIRKYPGEITLLGIGTMTNIGLLFATDPEIPSLLKQLVVMCGLYTDRTPRLERLPLEWNAYSDPYATAIVYKAPLKICRSVGTDVTYRVIMNKNEVLKRFTAEILKPVLDFAEPYFEHIAKTNYSNRIIFHDPLAAAVIFDPDICVFKRGTVEIELESSRLKGFTHWKEDPDGIHEVALEVDSNRFFEHYFSIVK